MRHDRAHIAVQVHAVKIMAKPVTSIPAVAITSFKLSTAVARRFRRIAAVFTIKITLPDFHENGKREQGDNRPVIVYFPRVDDFINGSESNQQPNGKNKNGDEKDRSRIRFAGGRGILLIGGSPARRSRQGNNRRRDINKLLIPSATIARLPITDRGNLHCHQQKITHHPDDARQLSTPGGRLRPGSFLILYK